MMGKKWITRRPRCGGQPEGLASTWTAQGLRIFVMETNSLGATLRSNSGPGPRRSDEPITRQSDWARSRRQTRMVTAALPKDRLKRSPFEYSNELPEHR